MLSRRIRGVSIVEMGNMGWGCGGGWCIRRRRHWEKVSFKDLKDVLELAMWKEHSRKG